MVSDVVSTKLRINVVWFKCTDLRTHDHAALKAAHADGLPVLHLYVFDPFWHAGKTRLCGFPKTGVVRTRFQLECIDDLATGLQARGHRLNLRKHISTAGCFKELCSDYTINAVFSFHEICSEELRIQRQVEDVLRSNGQGPLKLFWGYELLHHDDLPFDPKTERAAVKEIEVFLGSVKGIAPRPSAQEQPTFTDSDMSVHWHRSCDLPDVAEVMGENYSTDVRLTADHSDFKWRGGETAALARVKQYLWDEDNLVRDYVGATVVRNLYRSPLNEKATSKLSPWLAHGCLSPRLLCEEVERRWLEYQRSTPSARDAKTYGYTHRLIRELIWRDFCRFGSLEAGTTIFKIGGRDKVVRWKQPVLKNRKDPYWEWSTDKALLQTWIDGYTGFPFVDAFMRELKVTGYCKHIGRLCAGWFLISDLGLDWRMGAEWLESVLIDFEPTLNWFNWVYACLEPVDLKKPPRGQQQCLEILEAGIQHDPDALYIKKWLPELSTLPSILAREPWRLDPQGIEWAPKSSSLRKMQFIRPSPTDLDHAAKRGTAIDEIVSFKFENEVDKASLNQPADTSHTYCCATLRMLSSICWTDSEHRPSFKHGIDYPKPMIKPVSLLNAKDTEFRVRWARACAQAEASHDLCKHPSDQVDLFAVNESHYALLK